MSANLNPIFILTPRNQWIPGSGSAGNTTRDLTLGTSYLLASASVNGSRIDEIRIIPLGTNVATVMRFWINNGLPTSVLTNNSLFAEVTCPSTTISEVAGLTPIIMKAGAGIPTGTPPLPDNGLVLAAGYRLYTTIGTAVAAGFYVVASGGDY
jgi:hypothetical protein